MTAFNQAESSSSKKAAEILLLLITWFAVLLQLAILKDSIFNFISYFTILCNLLVALSLSAKVASPRSKIGRYFSLVTVQTGIALDIFIVGLVYNTVLRGIWEPKGWQLVADNLLHVIVPFLYVLYWIICTAKGALKWKDGFAWAYFPFVYLIYSLIRGHFVDWYPYPFLNVMELGYAKVFINAGFVLVAFLLFGSLFIWADRLLKSKKY
ncbi:Pr6Pr family membrane protein [Pedobacter sp. Du54]|uniref:Pr6Pr family membrane protein n=1 Tax=Pedobacter anseongensis TaxID=3133439 RepID=UPI0030AC3B18